MIAALLIFQMKRIFRFSSALILLLLAAACGGAPQKSRCDVEVFSPNPSYSVAMLYGPEGELLDSTLSVVNDSIRFSRTDSLSMPYVATLRLINPADSLDMVTMPIVVEGGKVSLNLSGRLELSGTPGNEALFKFLKAKNSFNARYEREGNPDHDIEKLKKDYSKFYASQILLNKDNAVGKYLLKSYSNALTREDLADVKERMNN